MSSPLNCAQKTGSWENPTNGQRQGDLPSNMIFSFSPLVIFSIDDMMPFLTKLILIFFDTYLPTAFIVAGLFHVIRETVPSKVP
jgi:hypothetical protein